MTTACGSSSECSPLTSNKALALFKALRIQPRSVKMETAGKDYFPKHGRNRWCCYVTSAAFAKLHDHVTHELLLD